MGRGWEQQKSILRVRRFTERPKPLHWIAFPVEFLTKAFIHWMPCRDSVKGRFSSVISASSHPLPETPFQIATQIRDSSWIAIRRPAPEVSRALRARACRGLFPCGVSPGPSGRSVQKGSPECPRSVRNTFLGENLNRYTKRPLQDSAMIFPLLEWGESGFHCANHSVSCKCQQPRGWKIHTFFRWKNAICCISQWFRGSLTFWLWSTFGYSGARGQEGPKDTPWDTPSDTPVFGDTLGDTLARRAAERQSEPRTGSTRNPSVHKP